MNYKKNQSKLYNLDGDIFQFCAWELNLNIKQNMQRKRSSSHRKNSKKKSIVQKKKQCSFCQSPDKIVVFMQIALFRKYTQRHITYIQIGQKCLRQNKQSKPQIEKEHLQRYYKINHRKHQFSRIKQIYKLHNQSPKLLMPEIRQIINKCYHRKRLLEYFRIAKILGLRVETVKFSTFLLSQTKSYNKHNNKSYDKMIGQISGYEFSQEVQKQLIQSLSAKQNNCCLSNICQQNNGYDKFKQHETATSFNNIKLRF